MRLFKYQDLSSVDDIVKDPDFPSFLDWLKADHPDEYEDLISAIRVRISDLEYRARILRKRIGER